MKPKALTQAEMLHRGVRCDDGWGLMAGDLTDPTSALSRTGGGGGGRCARPVLRHDLKGWAPRNLLDLQLQHPFPISASSAIIASTRLALQTRPQQPNRIASTVYS